ncbi:MAG: HAD family hydrolase [Kiritimatiellae bacterium]|nr:HAD family hydrolase [Kiritimatiellia bacterium]
MIDLSPVRHIIWDWNGTLLDDVDAALNAINRMLQARGLPTLGLTRYRDIFGFPVRDFYRKAGFVLEREDWDAMAEEFHRLFLSEPAIRLHRHARETLQHIRDLGIPQSILSASEQSILTGMLRDYDLVPFFTHICGVDNLNGASKLELGETLVRRIQLPPETILMIGDTLHDAEVARALGIRCLLIASGHQSAERLATAGCNMLPMLSTPTPHQFR